MTGTEFECVLAKRRAQRSLRLALRGKTPKEQAEEIVRRGQRNPIWQQLLKRTTRSRSASRTRTGR